MLALTVVAEEPPSPPHASPPLPLLHRQSATAAAPGRWQYATAAATGTADVTTTVAATGIAVTGARLARHGAEVSFSAGIVRKALFAAVIH